MTAILNDESYKKKKKGGDNEVIGKDLLKNEIKKYALYCSSSQKNCNGLLLSGDWPNGRQS